MDYREQFNFWLEDDYFDEDTKNELLAIRNDDKEVEDRFYRDLEFGTGGLRGVIGAGTNRMNLYTVRKATQGLANYILAQGTQDKGISIAYDSRRMSPEFADEAALCMAANGIKAYVFDALRPTPELSNYRKPQSSRVQRIQGILGRRRSDYKPQRQRDYFIRKECYGLSYS